MAAASPDPAAATAPTDANSNSVNAIPPHNRLSAVSESVTVDPQSVTVDSQSTGRAVRTPSLASASYGPGGAADGDVDALASFRGVAPTAQRRKRRHNVIHWLQKQRKRPDSLLRRLYTYIVLPLTAHFGHIETHAERHKRSARFVFFFWRDRDRICYGQRTCS